MSETIVIHWARGVGKMTPAQLAAARKDLDDWSLANKIKRDWAESRKKADARSH